MLFRSRSRSGSTQEICRSRFLFFRPLSNGFWAFLAELSPLRTNVCWGRKKIGLFDSPLPLSGIITSQTQRRNLPTSPRLSAYIALVGYLRKIPKNLFFSLFIPPLLNGCAWSVAVTSSRVTLLRFCDVIIFRVVTLKQRCCNFVGNCRRA